MGPQAAHTGEETACINIPMTLYFLFSFPSSPDALHCVYNNSLTHSLTSLRQPIHQSINQSINPKQVRALPAVVVFPRGRIKECDDGLDRRCCGKYR